MNDLCKYTYVPETNELVTEASTLGWAPGMRPDCLVIDGVTFLYAKTKRNEDGDHVAWLYRPVPGTSIISQVRVFND